jgi:hypothetical protein
MAHFDKKSILKIVGTYTISGEIASHDVNDDILTIVYNNSFYQATIGDLQSHEDLNNFSILTEVDNFQTTSIVLLLRTKIDDRDVVLQTLQPIEPPDDFLSNIIEKDFVFIYDGIEDLLDQSGCTQPQYPNYDCSARLDEGCLEDTIGCTNPTACTCDEPRCMGLCGVCDNSSYATQYECEQAIDPTTLESFIWTEYCGDEENQWQCGTTQFGFYNPSLNISPNDTCTFEYELIEVKFTGGNIIFYNENEYPGSPHTWDNRDPLEVIVDTHNEINGFNIMSFEMYKIKLSDEYTITFESLDGNVINPTHTISIIDMGSISKVIIDFDELFTGTFIFKPVYDDIITLRSSLNNITFTLHDSDVNIPYKYKLSGTHGYVDVKYPGTVEGDLVDRDSMYLINLFYFGSYLNQIGNSWEEGYHTEGMILPELDCEDGVTINQDGGYDGNYKLHKQTIKLHRGRNEISLFTNRCNKSTVPLGFYKLKVIFGHDKAPFVERISTFAGEIYKNENNVWLGDYDGVDAAPNIGGGGEATSFDQIVTDNGTVYTVTVCSDNIDIENNDYCYDNDGYLKNEFKIEYYGHISTYPTRKWHADSAEYGEGVIETFVKPKAYSALTGIQLNVDIPYTYPLDNYQFGALASNIDNYPYLNVAVTPQCKELLYDTGVNTILSMNSNIPTMHDNGKLRDEYGLQSRYIDLIQYETELITHVDMDFDCEYDENGTVVDGTCYDTWLGTLTNLSMGRGYNIKMNQSDFYPVYEIPGVGSVSNINPKIDMSYDSCGICSGGATDHIHNSDMADDCFCVKFVASNDFYEDSIISHWGGEGYNQYSLTKCFTNDNGDDVCFGTCCQHPNKLVDLYEDGDVSKRHRKICDTSSYSIYKGGELQINTNLEYKTRQCLTDGKEYDGFFGGTVTWGGAGTSYTGCEDNCSGECVGIIYRTPKTICDTGIIDCFDNCHDTITSEFAYFDQYGICCKIGNMDAAGICFGNSVTDETGENCGFVYQTTFEPVNITVGYGAITQNGFINNEILPYSNTGQFEMTIETGEIIGDIYIPFTGIDIFSAVMVLFPDNEDYYISFVGNAIYIAPQSFDGQINSNTRITITISYSAITEEHLCINQNISIDTLFNITLTGIDYSEDFDLNEDGSQCFRTVGDAWGDWQYYGCNDSEATNEDSNCYDWGIETCDIAYCVYDGDNFLRLLGYYFVGTPVQGVTTPVDLDTWLLTKPILDIQTHLNDLLDITGISNLNRNWAIDYYTLLLPFEDDINSPYYGYHLDSYLAGVASIDTEEGYANETEAYRGGIAFGQLCANNTCDDCANNTCFDQGETSIIDILGYTPEAYVVEEVTYDNLSYNAGYNAGFALQPADNIEAIEYFLIDKGHGGTYELTLPTEDDPNETGVDFIIYHYDELKDYVYTSELIVDVGGVYGTPNDGFDDTSYDAGYVAGVVSVDTDNVFEEGYGIGYEDGLLAGGGSAANPEIPITANVWNFVGYGYADSSLILTYALTSFNDYLTSGDMIQGPSNIDGTISTIVYNETSETWDGSDNFELQPGRGYRVFYQRGGIFQWSTQVPDIDEESIENVCGQDIAYNYYTPCGNEEDNLYCPDSQNYDCCIGPGDGFSYSYYDTRYCGDVTALNYNPNLTDCQNNTSQCIGSNNTIINKSGANWYVNELKFLLDFAILNNLVENIDESNYQITENFEILISNTDAYFTWQTARIKSIHIGTTPENNIPNIKIPYSIGVLVNVDDITISYSDLSFLPSSLQNRLSNDPPLINLDLSNNSLTTNSFLDGNHDVNLDPIEDMVLDLTKFDMVNLSNNSFEIFPQSILFDNENLITDLNISNNPITIIPTEISNIGSYILTGLNSLNISYLDLSEENNYLPTELFENSELGDVNSGGTDNINCANTEIQIGNVFCFRGLYALDISGNEGIEWDEGMTNSAIYELKLNDNNYTSIFTLLSKTLRILHVNDNNLTINSPINEPINRYFPSGNTSVQSPSGLMEINISNNNLTQLGEHILYTPDNRSLNILDISYNTTIVINGILPDEILNYEPTPVQVGNNVYNVGRFASLNFRSIGLEELPEEQPEFFSYFPFVGNPFYVEGIHHIDIAENPFYCECDSLSVIAECDIPQWVKDGLSLSWIVGFDNRTCGGI